MKYIHYFLTPTILIFIGLILFSNMTITFILFYGWLLIVPVRTDLRSYTFKRTALSSLIKRNIGYGLLTGFIAFLFIVGGLLYWQERFINSEHIRNLLVQWGFSGHAVLGLIFILIVVNPFLEELYWRGTVQQQLKKQLRTGHAIWVSSLFYSLYHLLIIIPLFQYPLPITVAISSVFIAGIFWGYMREKTNSLIASMISHALADLGIICVYWFIIR